MMKLGGPLAKLCPSNIAFQASMLKKVEVEVFAPSNAEVLSHVPLQIVYPDVFEGSQFAPLVGVEQTNSSLFGSDVENATLLLPYDPSLDDLRSQSSDDSFNSIISKSFIVKNIEALGIESDISLSSTSKKRMSYGDDSASSTLKKYRA